MTPVEALQPSAEASESETCDGEGTSFSTEDFLSRSFAQGLDPARVAVSSGGGVPDCPIRNCRCSNCQRPFFCQIGGSCFTEDTGLSACQLNGTAISCPSGQTIHLVNADCELPDGQSCGPLNYCGSATISGSCQ